MNKSMNISRLIVQRKPWCIVVLHNLIHQLLDPKKDLSVGSHEVTISLPAACGNKALSFLTGNMEGPAMGPH